MNSQFFSSLRFRITVLFVMYFAGALLVSSGILYFVYRHQQIADLDRSLYNRAQEIPRSIEINVGGQLSLSRAFGNEYIEVRSPSGRSLAHSNNLGQHSLPFDSKLLARLQEKRFVYVTLAHGTEEENFWGEEDLRILNMPLMANGQLKLFLQLGISTQVYEKSLKHLRMILFFIDFPFACFLAGIGGWWLTGRIFHPINRMVAATRQLSAERLEDRLPVPESDDELRNLSITLNEMLDRLENAFKSQQRFVADASHELKTPLTILQGELDVLQQQPRTITEYQDFLASASEEFQRLSQIIHNLLLLARADSGRPLELKKEVQLEEIILEVVERLQSFAKRLQIKLSIQIEDETELLREKAWSTVRGDSDLLASLFFNLLHNAIKYSAAGQTVEIGLKMTSSGPCVSVRDEGTGIRPEDLPHIFERFHRAENPTRRQVSGTGLGLAISRWIAEAHGANIAVESKPAEGTTFSVLFRK